MGKKILSKKNIIRFFSGLAIIGSIIDFYLLRTGIAKWVFSLFKRLFNLLNLEIPVYVLLIFILIFLMLFIFFNKNFPKRVKRLKLNSKQEFILFVIGNASERSLERDKVFAIYQKKYPDKLRLPFNLVIEELKKYDLIRKSTDLEDYEYLEITETGLSYLAEIQKEIEKNIRRKKRRKSKEILNDLK